MSGSDWLLLSGTFAVLAAAWSGYRSLLILAALYALGVVAWWFIAVAPERYS